MPWCKKGSLQSWITKRYCYRLFTCTKKGGSPTCGRVLYIWHSLCASGVEHACNSHTLLLGNELTWVSRQLDIKMCGLKMENTTEIMTTNSHQGFIYKYLLGCCMNMQWILKKKVTNMTWTRLCSILQSAYRPGLAFPELPQRKKANGIWNAFPSTCHGALSRCL